MKDNKIYIVFSSTNTKIGKIIRFITKNQYNHISISLDKKIKEMYSFARYYRNMPLVGGFVTESALRYISNTNEIKTKICELTLTDKQYADVLNYINSIKCSNDYIYNTLSATLSPLQKDYTIHRSFTCLSFVNELLNTIGYTKKKLYTIRDAEQLLNDKIIYEGNMLDVIEAYEWGEDNYYEKKGIIKVIRYTIGHFKSLIYRLIKY